MSPGAVLFGMPRSRMRRANLLLLAVLLAGGGSGLPLLDAALHHLGGVRRSGTQLHGCDLGETHSERCTLGTALPVLAGARRQATRVPGTPLSVVRDTGLHITRPTLVTGPSPALPRAPPPSPA